MLEEMPSARQIKAVDHGDVDLAFVRKPTVINKNQVLSHFLSEPIVAVVAADHPQASSEQINMRLLAGDDFVFTPELLGESYNQQLRSLCEQAGFVPRIVQ